MKLKKWNRKYQYLKKLDRYIAFQRDINKATANTILNRFSYAHYIDLLKQRSVLNASLFVNKLARINNTIRYPKLCPLLNPNVIDYWKPHTPQQMIRFRDTWKKVILEKRHFLFM